MPLTRELHINKHTVLGIWHIIEDVKTLENKIVLTEKDKEIYSNFSNDKRKLQWLSYRILLKELLPEISTEIEYDNHGKPKLIGNEIHISISHSGDYSVVIISNSVNVGVDIELLSEKITKVESKFVNTNDFTNKSKFYNLENLMYIWCAKEAIYKSYGKQGISFYQNITIKRFKRNNTIINYGFLNYENIKKKYLLYHLIFNNYMLVYCIEY